MTGSKDVLDAERPACGSPRALRVLLAEDNPALAKVTRFSLERAGYQVVVATTGLEAWSLVQREAIDALVTDEHMPEMTGSELCARMRAAEAHRKTPVLMVTARSLEMDHSDLVNELGVTQVMGKPFSPRELVKVVGQMLHASPDATESG